MKKVLAAFFVLGAVYFATAYDVKVEVTEVTAAACDAMDPMCDD